MMKSTEDRPSSDFTEPLNGTKKRYVLIERQMSSEPVVITRVGRKNPAQMDFAEDDSVIEAFSMDRADRPLRMPVLPG
jgi:hypothetical protein